MSGKQAEFVFLWKFSVSTEPRGLRGCPGPRPLPSGTDGQAGNTVRRSESGAHSHLSSQDRRAPACHWPEPSPGNMLPVLPRRPLVRLPRMETRGQAPEDRDLWVRLSGQDL